MIRKVMIVLFMAVLTLVLPSSLLAREDLQPIYTTNGTASNGKLGWNITRVDSVNNDAVPDYIVGAPGENKVYVFLGPMTSSFTTASADWKISGPTASNFGWDVSGVPDYNGDGYNEIIIGAPGVSKAYIFRGRTGTATLTYSSANIIINGITGTNDEMLGHSVAGIDYEGKGRSFAVVGAPRNNHYIDEKAQYYSSGAVYLFNLSYCYSKSITSLDSSLNSNLTFRGNYDNGWFGFNVKNVGDADGDSVDDLAASDPYFTPNGMVDKGVVYFQYGKPLMFEVPDRLTTGMDGYVIGFNQSRLGWSIAGLGDIKGGPGDEVILGAPFDDEGKAYSFLGGTTLQVDLPVNGIPTATDIFNGTVNGDRFGWSFASMDLSNALNKNVTAITIGAPGYDNVSATPTTRNVGGVFSFWSWSGTTPTALEANAIYIGKGQGDNLGYSVSPLTYTYAGKPVQCILAATPYEGSTDTGQLMVLRKNELPFLYQVTCNPNIGNRATDFTILATYKDIEGDLPRYIRVDVYSDNTGTNMVKQVDLTRDPSDTNPISDGVKYKAVTKLPNSISASDLPSSARARLYMKGFAQAIRGSISEVNSGILIDGPIVDGVKPSAADNINKVDLKDEEKVEGTFKIAWEWPEENEGFNDRSNDGKVTGLYVRYKEGNVTATNLNWDTFKFYKNITSPLEIKELGARDEHHFGKNDIASNPLNVRFQPEKYYSIAFRAVDEEGNWGNVSATTFVQAWFRPTEIPGPCIEVYLEDYKGPSGMGDDGGQLRLTFTPPQMQYIQDITSYWVFIDTKNFDEASDFGNPPTPNQVITEEDEEGFTSYTKILTNIKGEPLQDGQEYFASVMAVNKRGQYTNALKVSDPAKVINDNRSPLPRIRDVDAVINVGQNKITVTWSTATDPSFVWYEVYGQSYYFDTVTKAIKLGTINDKTVTQFVVDNISGVPITQSNLFSFAVLVMDHNDHIDYGLDENNTVHGVKYRGLPGNPPQNPRGVSLIDVPDDGGGALSLSWFNLLTKGQFWQYNVYLDDEPFTDLTDMTPIAVIGDYKVGEFDLMELDGEPLLDGKIYYAAVTISDWDLQENRSLDENNYDWCEPINQSDNTPPKVIPAGLTILNTTTNFPSKSGFNVSWTPVAWEQVMDFNHYLVQVQHGLRYYEFQLDDISEDYLMVTGLERGTKYYVSIRVVDDNANKGPESLQVGIETAGKNRPPVIINVTILVNEITSRVNNTEQLDIDLNDLVGEVYFTAEVVDDYTKSTAKFKYLWNITTPKGESSEKTSYTFGLELPKDLVGIYTIRLKVSDDEGATSPEYRFTINAMKKTEPTTPWGLITVIVFIVILLLAVGVVIFVTMTGKKSQQKQMVEQYEDRRKDIETMDLIYTDLPTWTCSCGTTQIQIIENANCPSCYESHEAVPITGMDQYLRDHDLVLAEMRIKVPPAWQGQDMAMDRAKKDLEDRKKRALESLNEEFAPFLKGTKYESEVKPPVAGEGIPMAPQPSTSSALYHAGAIIPGQMPPTSPTHPMPGPAPPQQPFAPMPMYPGMQPGQPQVGRPFVPPMIGQPGQRPPFKPQ